jgi:hypothetical protein
MTLVLKDRVRETTTTTGTGALTLAGAVTGFQTFSAAIGNGNTTYYAISRTGSSEWEVGIGTISAGVLTRTTVLASSNSGSAVSLSAGTKDVYCALPADKSAFLDASDDLSFASALLRVNNIRLGGTIKDSSGNDPLWISVSFHTGFGNVGSPRDAVQYCKDAFGIVHMRGVCRDNGGSDGTILTLPSGYRPTGYTSRVWTTNDTPGIVIIDGRDGVVTNGGPDSNYLDFNNIQFPAF